MTDTVEAGGRRTFLRPPARVTLGTVAKLLFLGVVNSVGVWAIGPLVDAKEWAGLVFVALATLALDYAYLSRKRLPMKYLLPGTIFLLAFQVYPVVYNAYIAFTNYGTGNILTKSQAVDRIVSASFEQKPGSPRYEMVPLAKGGTMALLLTDPTTERSYLGTGSGLKPLTAADVTTDHGLVTGATGGWKRLTIRQAQDRQTELLALTVPADGAVISPQTFSSATVVEAALRYDAKSDTITDTRTGTTYRPAAGTFTSADGKTLTPGWHVVIGWKNFARVFASPAIRGPFLRVFVWTFAYAVLSVFLTFVVGLGLAVTLNHPRMRGKRLYRSLLIIPYALPSFMSAVIWAGMMNQQFGVFNRMLGAGVPWLTDPWLAKVSVLLVNMWLGFPYMMLITTGALQSIPAELTEAARVDGATPTKAFRTVAFPLLLISVAPLLIASFAFNFNNFNAIYLLTQGGPPMEGTTTPAGHTDLLITYTYRLAFGGGRGTDFGFACAISVLIFVMIAAVSAYSFRHTRALEELA